ncbi:MAG: type II methionyl aminopeptidase [Candidatus Hermodarchaeia archaeon]|jgi:methionyl aminopeptidase
MPDDEQFAKIREKLLQAGKIASEALAFSCSLVKQGESLLAIAEAGEKKILELGGKPAFPLNISINHHAAHYTPSLDDASLIPELALVKIDLGAHVDGYVADNASTVLVGYDENLQRLIDSAKAGLQAAIKTAKAGIRIWNISKAISSAMHQMKTRPIENLTGHSIEQFNLHAGVSVPSVTHSANRVASPRLQKNMVVAIEPFATYSRNPLVDNLKPGHIFGFVPRRNPKDPKLQSLFSQMKIEFAQLPFASRWMTELVELSQVMQTLNQLTRERCIHNYSILGLQDGSPIAQAEHTIIVEKQGCTVTTLHP